MFYIIGLGLSDVEDITLKGLEIVKKCDKVYLESYTSLLTAGKDELEKFYGRNVEVADRELVEQNSDVILNEAKTSDVAFLVVGDPFGATTHTDIILRAKEKNIPYQVVHNASIINAVGCCGLQLYTFGETVSIPFWTDSWKPDSFYDKIMGNKSRGLHTLCLLDIKIKEPSLESLMKKKKEYLPPRFMTVNEAATQLLLILQNKGQNICMAEGSLEESTRCVGLGRVGSSTQKVIWCTLKEMTEVELGPPLHCLIVPGKLQVLEEQYLSQFTSLAAWVRNLSAKLCEVDLARWRDQCFRFMGSEQVIVHQTSRHHKKKNSSRPINRQHFLKKHANEFPPLFEFYFNSLQPDVRNKDEWRSQKLGINKNCMIFVGFNETCIHHFGC